MLPILSAAAGRLPATALDSLARWIGLAPIPGWKRRAAGHSKAVSCLLGRPVPGSSLNPRTAVARHILWTLEFLAEMGGREFEIEDATGSLLTRPSARGRLLVTVHTGNWIVAARFLHGRSGPVHTVAGTQLHAGWDADIRRFLGRRGVHFCDPKEGPVGLRLAEILRGGGTVLLHLDGDPTGGSESETVPLGVRAAARIAARTGAEVVAGDCRRIRPGRFRVEAERLIVSDTHRPIRAWEETLLEFVRTNVTRDPDDWLIFRHQHLGRCSEYAIPTIADDGGAA